MNKSALRFAIAAQWLLGALATIVGVLEDRNLPEELQSYMRAQTAPDALIVALASILLVSLMIACIGILTLKSWARRMYALVTFLAIAAMALDGPRVSTPIANTLGEYSLLFIGVTLGLLFATQGTERS